MSSKLILNDSNRQTSFSIVLRQLLEDASALDIAVSYIQSSGWDVLERLTPSIDPSRIRLLVTDQFGISHPDALRKAKERGVGVRVFVGRQIYHPKVYISYDANGRAKGAIVGSANLSVAALETSVEVGCLLIGEELLTEVENWFQQLFDDQINTTDVDANILEKVERAWRSAAKARVQVSRVRRRSFPEFSSTPAILPEDVDVIDDLFSAIKLPISVLSIDQAGNNIRNLTRLLNVLRRYPAINRKERSELSLLGLSNDDRLTEVGETAKRCRTEKGLGKVWCQWVYLEEESYLQNLNSRILNFKRAATQFWNLRPEVRDFFINNVQSKTKRNTLKVIELLCSGSDVVRELELADFESLVPIVTRWDQLPPFLSNPILDYWDNKGNRSWDSNDRVTLLTAWRGVIRESL